MIHGAIVVAFTVNATVAAAQHAPSPTRVEQVVAANAEEQIRPAPPTWTGARKGCCSRKHILIGAAIGAGVGALLTLQLCDAGDCTSSYVTSMAAFAGIGAGIGALISRSAADGIQIGGDPPRHRIRLGITVQLRRRNDTRLRR
jgi:hypothetical protein